MVKRPICTCDDLECPYHTSIDWKEVPDEDWKDEGDHRRWRHECEKFEQKRTRYIGDVCARCGKKGGIHPLLSRRRTYNVVLQQVIGWGLLCQWCRGQLK